MSRKGVEKSGKEDHVFLSQPFLWLSTYKAAPLGEDGVFDQADPGTKVSSRDGWGREN